MPRRAYLWAGAASSTPAYGLDGYGGYKPSVDAEQHVSGYLFARPGDARQ